MNDPSVAGRSDDPVIGWRAWNLAIPGGTDGRLPSLRPVAAGGEPWPPMQPMQARCGAVRLFSLRPRHAAPTFGCRCGIYASRSLLALERPRPAWPPPTVVGTTSLWGRVIEHERGWRASLAYPVRLRLVCAMCSWFEPGPGRPVCVHRIAGCVYALCPLHRGGIELPDGRRSSPTGLDPARLQARLLDAYAVDVLPFEQVSPLFRQPRTPDPPGYWPTIRVVPA